MWEKKPTNCRHMLLFQFVFCFVILLNGYCGLLLSWFDLTFPKSVCGGWIHIIRASYILQVARHHYRIASHYVHSLFIDRHDTFGLTIKSHITSIEEYVSRSMYSWIPAHFNTIWYDYCYLSVHCSLLFCTLIHFIFVSIEKFSF